MAKPLQLSDEHKSAILHHAAALTPADQKLMYERVIEQLSEEAEIGDGLVFRICRAAQRELWAPPDDSVGRSTHWPQPLRKIR